MDLMSGIYQELKWNVEREVCHLRVKPLCSIVFLTYRCTNCCKTCNIWQMGSDGSDELDRDGWVKAVARMNRLGVKSLEIFGGDALLRKDAIFDVLHACREHGMLTYFPTNANLCDTETVTRLLNSGLDTLYISVDDIEEANDQVRGETGNFARIRGAIESFLRLRGDRETPRLDIICTLSRMNFRNFPRLVEFMEQYPVSAIHPRPLAEFSTENIRLSGVEGVLPEPFFRPTDGSSHLITPEELHEFRAMISYMKRRQNKVYVCWTTYYATDAATYLRGEYPPAQCRMATTLMTICPNGDVTPCPMYRNYVLGNIARDNPEGIWGNARHRRFIEAQQGGELKVCLNCNIRPDHNSSLPDMVKFYAIRSAEKSGLYLRC